jgi:SAM-dependent methyltransferase
MTYALSAEAAEFYESTFVPALFGPWAAHLAGVLAPGDRVVDVACGTGAVARAAAGRTGAEVVGVDRNENMLAIARRLRPDLSWRAGDAHALPFADAAFDWALSQAALMFFDDRVAALREMGRVASRVGLQVPGRLSRSPGYLALAEVVGRHAGPAARDVVGGYFSAGEPDLLRDLCARAGLRIERFETRTGATRLPSVETFLDAELLPLSGVPEMPRIVAGARAALAPFVSAGGAVAAPLEVHLVIARPGAEDISAA